MFDGAKVLPAFHSRQFRFVFVSIAASVPKDRRSGRRERMTIPAIGRQPVLKPEKQAKRPLAALSRPPAIVFVKSQQSREGMIAILKKGKSVRNPIENSDGHSASAVIETGMSDGAEPHAGFGSGPITKQRAASPSRISA